MTSRAGEGTFREAWMHVREWWLSRSIARDPRWQQQIAESDAKWDDFVARGCPSSELTSADELRRTIVDDGCPNCDGRKCMGCVMRDWAHDCADDCPVCCADLPQQQGETTELAKVRNENDRLALALILIRNEASGHGDINSPQYDMTLDQLYEIADAALSEVDRVSE